MTHLSDTHCHDCHLDTLPTDPDQRAEYYMVVDEVWQTALLAGILPGLDQLGAPAIRYLCVLCLEARIGRRLVAADFQPCPVNDLTIADEHHAWSWRTPRLQGRLAAGGQL